MSWKGLKCTSRCVLETLGSKRTEHQFLTMPQSESTKKGQARYIAKTLEQPMLLLRDMEAYRRFSQHELFLSLKRDLAMVR